MTHYLSKIIGIFCLSIIPSLHAQSYGEGTLVVLNKSGNDVSLISLTDGNTQTLINVGEGPHEVIISQHKGLALVSNYGTSDQPGNSISVIDLNDKKEIQKIDLGEYKRPHGLAWCKDGEIFLVTAEADQVLLMVEMENGAIMKVFSTQAQMSHMVAYSDLNNMAFTTNMTDGTVTAFDLKEEKPIKIITTGKGAEGIAISKDETEVWVSNREANTISIISIESLEVKASLETDDFPIRISFSTDGQLAFISNAKAGNVAVYDVHEKNLLHTIAMEQKGGVDNNRIAGSISEGPVPIGVAVHPHAPFAFVSNSNADIITVLDLENMQIAGTIEAGKEPDGISFYEQKQ